MSGVEDRHAGEVVSQRQIFEDLLTNDEHGRAAWVACNIITDAGTSPGMRDFARDLIVELARELVAVRAELARKRTVRGRRRRHPERDAEIARLIGDGLTLAAVGAMFGLGRKRVRQIAIREGVNIPELRARQYEGNSLVRREKAAKRQDRRDPKRNTERDAEIARLIGDGLTLAAVGAKFDVTRERVRQIAIREGVNIPELRARQAAERQACRDAKRAEAEAARLRTCIVCGRTFASARGRGTCSDACTLIRKQGRRYLSDDQYLEQRMRAAESVLRHPDKHTAAQVAYSRRIVAGQPLTPNRRYTRPGSRISQALRDAGLEHLLPGPRQPEPLNQYRCHAVNLNGRPCSRTVAGEGDLCHIHRAMVAGVTIADLAGQEDR